MPTLLYLSRFDESGASSRYRVYQYFDDLKNLGFNITVNPLLNHFYLKNFYFKKKRPIFFILNTYLKRAILLLRLKSKFDVVLMDGELFPYLPYFLEKIFLPKNFIIDQDDAIFHTYDKHRSPLVRILLGKKIKKIWRRSDCITVCNTYVKNKAISMGVRNVFILPTVVNANLYKPPSFAVNKKYNAVIIGWVGSPTTICAVDYIKQALINVSKRADIMLYVIGAQYDIPGIQTYCVDWKNGWNEQEEINLTNEIDIGIMPLLDGPYQQGKGGFKLIKYMACEKPMIASPIGINTEIVDHGMNGYLAANPAEWEKYLFMLITDAEKRKTFGLSGRKKMLAQYSTDVISPQFCDIVARFCK